MNRRRDGCNTVFHRNRGEVVHNFCVLFLFVCRTFNWLPIFRMTLFNLFGISSGGPEGEALSALLLARSKIQLDRAFGCSVLPEKQRV